VGVRQYGDQRRGISPNAGGLSWLTYFERAQSVPEAQELAQVNDLNHERPFKVTNSLKRHKNPRFV
jgi:hypothetical protein